jgi:hypothetical protein
LLSQRRRGAETITFVKLLVTLGSGSKKAVVCKPLAADGDRIRRQFSVNNDQQSCGEWRGQRRQAQPPLFRPIATDVKAEKRFLSTIARRLDTLGAITRGQRQTGGQSLFRPEDNLESQYGRDALRQLYILLARGKVGSCSLERFEDATGLKLTDANGLREMSCRPFQLS